MELTPEELLTAFLWSVPIGVGLGALYEPFRFLRIAGLRSRAGYIVTDIVFVLLSALVTFLYCLASLGGRVRFFIVFGECIGFVAFRFTIGQITDKIYVFVCKIVKKIFFKLLKTLKKMLYNILYESRKLRDKLRNKVRVYEQKRTENKRKLREKRRFRDGKGSKDRKEKKK